MDNITFELIAEKHLTDIMDIYNYYIRNTTATFYSHEHTMENIKEFVYDGPRYKSFVIYYDGALAGYIMLKRHENCSEYDLTADIALYLKPDSTGKGIGGVAVRHIENAAKREGFHSLIASICTENQGSIRLFEKCGYVNCSHFKEVGWKFNRFLDNKDYQKFI